MTKWDKFVEFLFGRWYWPSVLGLCVVVYAVTWLVVRAAT
jgi:hypothetical protein